MVIRADGGLEIGLGHIKRCEVLAGELARRHCRVTFLIQSEPFVLGYLRTAGFETVEIPPCPDRLAMFEATSSAVAALRPGLVFLDILNTEKDFVKSLKSSGARVVSIDDLGPGGSEVDALVGEDVGVLEDSLPAEVKETAAARIFGGLDYVIMSPRFDGLRGAGTPERFKRRELYIGFGGSDPRGTTELVVSALLDWPEEFTANIVIGPCMANPERVEKLAAQDPKRFTVHRDPPNLPQLMSAAALAICNVGQSLFELAMLGVPCLLITSSPLQELFAVHFERNGCAVRLGLHDEFSPAKMLDSCAAVLNGESRWRQMSEAAAKLIDGRGAARIADIIMNLLAGRQP